MSRPISGRQAKQVLKGNRPPLWSSLLGRRLEDGKFRSLEKSGAVTAGRHDRVGRRCVPDLGFWPTSGQHTSAVQVRESCQALNCNFHGWEENQGLVALDS